MCNCIRKKSESLTINCRDVLQQHSPISHQTGATFSELSDQIIEFTAVIKLDKITTIAKVHTPIFHIWSVFLGIESSTSIHPMKFAIGTRGNVGSMLVVCGKDDATARHRSHLYIDESVHG